jgi:hypothetical protein
VKLAAVLLSPATTKACSAASAAQPALTFPLNPPTPSCWCAAVALT